MAILKGAFSKSYAGILLVAVALVTLFAAVNPVFLSGQNISAMLRAMSYTGIIALGMGLCMISGVLDLSVGATAGFCSVFFGACMARWGIPLALAVPMTLAVGASFGFINSLVIVKLGVNPFIATVSSMFAIRGLALAWNKGFLIYPLPEGIAELGNWSLGGKVNVSLGFLCLVALAVFCWWLLERTTFGLEIKATGSDYEVAQVTEVRFRLVRYVLMAGVGSMAALAGILLSFVLNAGAPNVGTGWEFAAITACAIGGVSMYGYEGSIAGILLGLLVVQVLQNGIVIVGVSVFLQDVVTGIALLVAIVLDVRRRKYLNLERI